MGGRLNFEVDPSASTASAPAMSTVAPAKNVASVRPASFMVLSTPRDILAARTARGDAASVLDATWETCKLLVKNAPLDGTKAADFPRHKAATSVASVVVVLFMLLTMV